MSDEESYEYEYDDDEDEEMNDGGGGDDGSEEESFEYTDDDQSNEEGEVAMENSYYNAKAAKETDLAEAEEMFLKVIAMEREELQRASGDGKGEAEQKQLYGPWSFKSMKQLVKCHLASNDTQKAMDRYDELLRCIASGSAVSQNAIEKGVNSMLERVAALYQGSASSGPSGSAGPNADIHKALARSVYDSTIRVFHPQTGTSPNERLWFKTLLKYGQLLYEMNETAKLQIVIRDLLRGSGQPEADSGSGTSEGISAATASGSTNHLEIFALQIQLYSRTKDNTKLREIFDKAMRVRGGIPHPRTLALIQELGGKMHMAAREYESAQTTFFAAFKSYDEAGDPARLRCLKYLVLSSMLHASSINPFDSQEAKPYRDDPEIVAVTSLVSAFQNNEIKRFEGILRRNEGKIKDDEFIKEHLSDLLRTIRTQVLRKVIGPFERISLKAIARELNGIPTEDVESLLVTLILDGRLDGRIDQVAGVLHKCPEIGNTSTAHSSGGGGNAVVGTTAIMGGSGSGASGSVSSGNDSVEMRNYDSIDALASALESLTTAVTSISATKSSGSALQRII